MNSSEWAGYVLTLLMGLSLGLIGAGGSILIVPILIFAFGMTASHATGASLAIVGSVALVGAVLAWLRGEIAGRAVVLFGIPSIALSFFVRRFLVPYLPNSVWGVSKDSLLLLLFAVVMLGAAWSMIRGKEPATNLKPSAWIWLTGGIGAGLVTGLLGAGGGFIVVPILHAAMGLPMKMAVGTSLALISLNASAGFIAESQSSSIDWFVIAPIGSVALVGLIVGTLLQKVVPSKGLKTGFGWMVVGVAFLILANEIFSKIL